MAREVTTYLVDDLTGERGEDVRTIRLEVDRQEVYLDLSTESRAHLDAALGEFLAAGRAVRGEVPSPVATAKRRSSPEQLRDIREWARGQGMDVSDRGRVPQAVVEAWRESHKAGSDQVASGAPAFQQAAEVQGTNGTKHGRNIPEAVFQPAVDEK